MEPRFDHASWVTSRRSAAVAAAPIPGYHPGRAGHRGAGAREAVLVRLRPTVHRGPGGGGPGRPQGRRVRPRRPERRGQDHLREALLGVVRPTAGSVRLLGGDPQDPRIRARVGYPPERLRFASAFTPLELLGSVARLKGCRLARRPGAPRGGGARVGGVTPGGHLLEGHAAAGGARLGAGGSSRAAGPRRAHRRPRPARPRRGAGAPGAADRGRRHGPPQLPPPRRDRAPLRPRRHPGGRPGGARGAAPRGHPAG
jgi:hypothetical protein